MKPPAPHNIPTTHCLGGNLVSDPLPYAFKYSDQALIFSTGTRPLTAGAYMFFRYASAIKSFKSVHIFLESPNAKIFMQLPEFMKFKLKK